MDNFNSLPLVVAFFKLQLFNSNMVALTSNL